ncbi:ubiquitin-conjugating enzyme/RWD-like protein [Glomus cerebriforme]|uniref:Ubiquitin-conjugating enzyme/RWD-like protein n=1 Tax=Glomus cerebriforme TaxID=658196 RepID=A0A397TXP6_9GLOM|nr:ubiquitin-conjugating enzyme/RWD-like protein [Glomus cerebriforme]
MNIESKTSFARSTGSNPNRDDDNSGERSVSGNNKPKPQFKDECFRKMDLMIEFTNLRNPNHCPSGVYVMPSADNFHTWFGVLFVHKGYYKNGVFKFKLDIPSDYPERPPAVKFIFNLINNNDGLFHPLVDPNTGSFSLSQQFKDWTPHKYYIFHVLHYIKKSFKKGVLDNLLEKHCPNKKAFTTYHNEIRTFGVLAKQCADLSITNTVLYDNNIEANPIQFSILPEEKLDELKTFINPSSSSSSERERPNYSSHRTYSTSTSSISDPLS